MTSAWLFQKPEQIAAMGARKAPWYVGWYDPDGRRRKKSFGGGVKGKALAERHKIKLEDDPTHSNSLLRSRKTWVEFCEEYSTRVLAGLAVATRRHASETLQRFQRIVKPGRVAAITTAHVDDFIAKRRREAGKKRGDIISPATVNKDLRHLKAALRVAADWGYLARVPKIRMEKAPQRLPRYVTAEHFAAIYKACDQARRPSGIANVSPADWWRALVVMAYMTGWRIGDLLAFRRDQLNLDAGTAISLADDNKGKRDELVDLHPVVVDHLRRLTTFGGTVFAWTSGDYALYGEWGRIQKAAGINLVCPKRHEHTPRCHLYGFHDLRRAFATMNADRLTPDALQALMRHKSYTTTQLYINMSRQMKQAVAGLHVPEILKKHSV
jgi:integrase